MITANRRYELKDHLGDVRVVVTDLKLDGTNGPGISPWIADVRAYNNPYSFGMLQAERSWGSDGYRYGFNGKEQDNDLKNATGASLDFGARMYDARVGRWWGVDPEERNSVSESPYTYVANQSISALDPDGRAVIFINGQHAGSGGARSYWRSVLTEKPYATGAPRGETWATHTYAWDVAAMNRIGDHNAYYYDGAVGGWGNTLTLGIGDEQSWNMLASFRWGKGREAAIRDAFSIFAALETGETIKIVGHSMGVAYSFGFTQGLLEQVSEWNNRYPERHLDPSTLIESIVAISPHAGASLTPPLMQSTKQMMHNDDRVPGGGRIPRVEIINDPEEGGGHGVVSFDPNDLRSSRHNSSRQSTWEEKPQNNSEHAINPSYLKTTP